MFADASALTAMLTDEHDARLLITRMQRYARRTTSALAVWETSIAVARILGMPVREAAIAVEDFLKLMEIVVVAVAPETRVIALEAFERYGKSRHPAALNFGDCFAYACAKHDGVPLLYKGDDFSQTDVETV